MLKKIIQIDENLCTGCGNCMVNCPQSALELIDTPAGKKALVKETLCDGLGVCLGTCPTGALAIIEKEIPVVHTGSYCCPSLQVLSWDKPENPNPSQAGEALPSQLRQWPVQLHLLPIEAPFLKNAHFLLTADCVPLAYGNFQQDFLQGRAIALACPKLDDNGEYREKLSQILKLNHPQSLEVVYMEVPCCRGLAALMEDALKDSGLELKLKKTKISIRGEILESENIK